MFSSELFSRDAKIQKMRFKHQESTDLALLQQHLNALEQFDLRTCSALFDWYKQDFQGVYLNDPKYKDYTIQLKEYDWRI